MNSPRNRRTRSRRLEQTRSGRVIVLAFGTLIAFVIGYFLLGMPGMNHPTMNVEGKGSSRMPAGMDMSATSTKSMLDPEEFGQAIAGDKAFVVNVHVPYDGEIADTDAFIAFKDITTDPRLPADRNTAIALYCRSGRMSKIARQELESKGYTNVVELKGGMQAWTAAGRRVLQTGS